MPVEDNEPSLVERRTNAQLGGTASAEAQAIDRYLCFLAGLYEPKLPTVDKTVWEAKIKDEPRLYKRVQLVAELERLENPVHKRELIEAESWHALDGFLRHGESFSARHQITYKAWRAMGVPPAVLKQIGVSPTYEANQSARVGGSYGNPGQMRSRPNGAPSNRQRVLTLLFKAGDDGLSTRDVREAEPDMNTGTISGSFGGLSKMGLARHHGGRWYLTEEGRVTAVAIA